MKKRFFTLSLIALPVLGIGLAGIFAKPAASKKVEAVSATRVPDFTGETQYVGEELAVSAVSSSETDFSTSYQVTYSTGGNSIYDNAGGSFVYVLGYDTGEDGLIAYAEWYKSLDVAVQDQMQEDIAAGKAETVSFTGYIFKFESLKSEVFIPKTISRGEYEYNSVYDVEIDGIAEHAFKKDSEVTKLYIPDTVLNIPAEAFSLASKLTDIYVTFEESEKPAGWEEGWNCGKTVHWGEDIYSYAEKKNRAIYEHSQSSKLVKVGNDDYNYIFGYYPKDQEEQYPITVSYNLKGSSETQYVFVEKTNEHANYDSVGGKIGTGASSNAYSNSLYIDIDLEKGQEVDFDSIQIHNIFEAESEKVEGVIVWKPKVVDGKVRRYYAAPAKVFSKVSRLDDFLTLEFTTVSNFGGYTSVNANASKVKNGLEIYKKVKPYYYDIYEKNLKSGKAVVRYRLTQLGKASFRVDTGSGYKTIKPHSPVTQYILRQSSDNNLGFVFKNSALGEKNYSFKNVKSFAVKGMTLTIDIVNDGTIIKTTAAKARFGVIYIKAPSDKMNAFDADLLLILLAVGYTAGALLLSSTLFFVYKNVFKNDEFRRLKPKQFIRKAIIYWATSLALVLMVAFTVIRCTAFANAIVVYNPVDVFIVIFGIASIIIIGYFIKNLVAAQKARSQRKKAIKLGLVNEVADDGTK